MSWLCVRSLLCCRNTSSSSTNLKPNQQNWESFCHKSTEALHRNYNFKAGLLRNIEQSELCRWRCVCVCFQCGKGTEEEKRRKKWSCRNNAEKRENVKTESKSSIGKSGHLLLPHLPIDVLDLFCSLGYQQWQVSPSLPLSLALPPAVPKPLSSVTPRLRSEGSAASSICLQWKREEKCKKKEEKNELLTFWCSFVKHFSSKQR